MDKLEAGRELDALVAEKVMGLNLTVIPETCPYCGGYVCQNRDPGWCGSCCAYVNEPEPYSTDIAAAWEMETEISRLGLVREYILCLAEECFGVQCLNREEIIPTTPELIWQLVHATPLQRCKAALKAVMRNEGA